MYENYPMTKQGQKGRIPFKYYSSKGFFMDSFKQINSYFQVIKMFCWCYLWKVVVFMKLLQKMFKKVRNKVQILKKVWL